MAIHTSLDYRNLDSTWDMTAFLREFFESGVLQYTGLITVGGTIQVAPFTLITAQGVLLWSDAAIDITLPVVAGVHKVYIAPYRTETSGIASTTIATKTTGLNFATDVCFGEVTVPGNTITYVNRMSLVATGTRGGRFRGLFPVATLPVAGSSDLKHGDLFVVLLTTGSMALYVYDGVAVAYRISTVRSTTQEAFELGTVASKIIKADGNTGKFNVGAGIELDGPTAKVSAPYIEAATQGTFPTAKADVLLPSSGVQVQFGTGAAITHRFLPSVDNRHNLGDPAAYWAKLYSYDAYINRCLPKTASSALGDSSSYWINGYMRNLFVHNIQPDSVGGSINMFGPPVPDVDNTRDLGSNAKRWKKFWGVDGKFDGRLDVAGDALIGSDLDVSGNVSAIGTLGAFGDIVGGANLDITGTGTIGGAATIGGGIKTLIANTPLKWKVYEGTISGGAAAIATLEADNTIISDSNVLGYSVILLASSTGYWVAPSDGTVTYNYTAWLDSGGGGVGVRMRFSDRGSRVSYVSTPYKIIVYYK